MLKVSESRQLSALDRAVLECVVYSDLFDFAVTPEEVWHWLPFEATQDEVSQALESDLFEHHSGGYVTLSGRGQAVERRRQRRVSSAGLQKQATRYGRWIARLPFVRMVAVTGSLAVENAAEDADIDYLIVTARGRLWLTRTMIMAVVRIAALRGIVVCPNYLLADDALKLSDRDLYTARELLQMRLVAGDVIHRRMQEENGWWREFLPNATPSPVVGTSEASSPFKGALEAILRLSPFDAVEAWILRRKGGELRAQAQSDEAVFDETMCKGHFEGWREQTRRTVAERVASLLEQTP